MINTRIVITIAIKELRLYVVNLSNFLVIAGVLLVMAFLFFNNFYAVGVSQVDDLFALFPWVFAILVPALSMGIIARERQEKTLQYVFAQPVTEVELVLGKFIGAFIFLALFPLVTVVIPLTLSTVANFDSGIIAAGYLGVLCLLALFLSVNLALSAAFSNQLAVFVTGFIVNLLFILLGSSLIGNILPQSFVPYVVQLSPIDHFSRISRGLIELSDLGYFVMTVSAFLLLSVWQLHLIRGGQINSRKIISGLSVQVLAVVLLAGAYFSFLIPGRVDITRDQLFTLSSGTQSIISSIENPLVIDVYVSSDLPPAFQPAIVDITRVVEEIKAINSSKVEINWKKPDQDATLGQEAQALGIFPQPFQVVSQTEYQAKEGYLGINVKYLDRSDVIPFINRTDNFEFQLMEIVYDLTVESKPVVALVHDSVNDPFSSSTALVDLLSSVYEVRDIELKDPEDNEPVEPEEFDGVEAFVIAGLAEPVLEEDINAINTKVEEGKSLVVFSSGVEIDLNSLSGVARETLTANVLLDKWGIRIEQNIVYDERNANLLSFTTAQGRVLLPYPYWITVGVEGDNPLLSQYRTFVLNWGSEVTATNEDAQAFLQTGTSAGVVSETIDLSPQVALSSADLASRVVGVHLPRSENYGDVIVLGSELMLRDDFVGSTGQSVLFANLLVDLATQGNDLASIKAKNRIPSSLEFTSDGQKNTLRMVNIIGGPTLVLLAGGFVWYLRRRKMARVYSVVN